MILVMNKFRNKFTKILFADLKLSWIKIVALLFRRQVYLNVYKWSIRLYQLDNFR